MWMQHKCGHTEKTIFTFPNSMHVGSVGLTAARQLQGSGDSRIRGKMATLLISLFFLFTISFLPNYRVNYYNYSGRVSKGVGHLAHV